MSTMSQELSALDKQMQALKLRRAGLGYDEIAKLVGYKSASGAFGAVRSALRKTLQEPADDLRKMELERLDVAMQAIFPMVTKGNLLAIDRYLKISERRSKLLGLDLPTQLEIGGVIAVTDT